MASKLTPEQKEIEAHKLAIAALEKREKLRIAAEKFASDNGFKSIADLVAELDPTAPKTPSTGKGKRPKKTPELVAKIKAMRKDDKTYAEIKAATGVGEQTIPKWLKLKS